MVDAVREYSPDIICHLGDHDRDTSALLQSFPDIPLHRVCGNCDFNPLSPVCLTVQFGPVRAFLTHGHRYHVDYGHLDSLVYAAQEAGANLVLFGHTHSTLHKDIGGVKVVNPGTAGKGKNRTWALLEVFENGGISVEFHSL